jgi:nucleoside-diphosphate-sugar epimerase
MIFGPADPAHRFHPIVKRIDDGRAAILFEEGMAAWKAPRGYVENVAAAIALAAVDDRAAGKIYNVAETPSFRKTKCPRTWFSPAIWRSIGKPIPPESAASSATASRYL